MIVQILGPVRLQRRDEPIVPSPRLARLLLGTLALRANTSLNVQTIKDALWTERAPKSAAANLRGYLAELRRLMTEHGPGPRIETGPSGYCLRADASSVDALLFDSLVLEGRNLLAAGDFETAANRLDRALGLWRGPVLDGEDVPESVQSEVNVLEMKRQDAIEDSVDARLALGEHRRLALELTGLVAQWPLRERLTGQLMLALCRSGRQVEALTVYHSLRKRLDEELGVRPFREVEELYRRILRADPELLLPGNPTEAVQPLGRRSCSHLHRSAPIADPRRQLEHGPATLRLQHRS